MQCDDFLCVDGNCLSFLLVHAYTHKKNIDERESEDTSEGRKKDTHERKQEDTHKRKADEFMNTEKEDVPIHQSRHTSWMELFPLSTT